MTNARGNAPFRILIDGACPLCRREGALLSRMDRGRGLLILDDITAPGFDPARFGRTMHDVMGAIHGVLPDGRVITGMEVFRLAYRLLGYGWLPAPTGWPVLRPMFDALYRWFARNRLRITFRSADACATNRCRV